LLVFIIHCQIKYMTNLNSSWLSWRDSRSTFDSFQCTVRIPRRWLTVYVKNKVTLFTSSCCVILASRGCILEVPCTRPAPTVIWPAVQHGSKLLDVQYSTTSFIFLSLVARIEPGTALISWLANSLF
jgi:hypothetical protein